MALPPLPHSALFPPASSSLTAPVGAPYQASSALGGVIGVAGGMPVYGGGPHTAPQNVALCCTAHVRFRAGEEQQSIKYTLQVPLAGVASVYSETCVRAIYWDIGVVPNQNPISELVRAFEGPEEDDIHNDPMALIGAGVWAPVVNGMPICREIPLSYGLPPGPLPRTQWCRAGIRPPKVWAIPAGAGFMIEVAFTRGWAPSREVDLTFTLELA